ncbi:MAG: alpha-amylase family glycosyl hydrolase, partial [Oscillospiraceae bacterium]
YESWWGFPTLPNVTETNPSYLQFVCGADGVLAHWMKQGVKGWRLDVADELPDAFLSALRHRIKQENPNASLVGEVWEDASNKSSYEIRRPYLLGEQLDSVMNYPWRTAILHYVKMGKAEDFYNAVMTIADHYPLPAIKTLMTSVSTHDTVRAITYLGVEHPVSDEQKGNYALTAEESEKGKFLFQITAMIQYTLPGFPCLYYGDEVGVSGFSDPWNRRCYPWGREDFQLLSFFQQLGQTRQEYAESFAQDFQFVAVDQGMIAYVRGNRILTAINRGTTDAKLSLEGAKILLSLGNVLSEQHSILVSAESAAIILLHP